MSTTRPALSPELSGAELRRWYWLRSELVDFARSLGLRTSGGKIELTARLVAALDGEPSPDQHRRQVPAPRLAEPLTDDTVIPTGQRSTQALRAYFTNRVGPGFRFDATMRAYLAAGDGRTLGQAVDHWHATRRAGPVEIAPQFELNRFTRAWFEAHPDGTRTELMAAWRTYRSLPVEARAER